jgi:SnoaL-like domain
MDDDLQEMLDHHRIRKVLATYCRGSDRCDGDITASVYARDSWDDHGIIKASGEEFSRTMCQMVIDTTETMTHLLGQSLIVINGDEAGAETYFFAVARDTAPDGTPMCNQLGGRFVDRLVREDGQWKVKHRTAMRDWSVAIPLTHDWDLSHTLMPGARSNADASFAVLGTVHSG